jgi:hypothetical protein
MVCHSLQQRAMLALYLIRNLRILRTLLLLLLFVITFMQSVYNYIPGTNHVSGVYSVAAIL